jgi:hypothetical protein
MVKFPECEVGLPRGEKEGSTAGQRVGNTLTRAETFTNISETFCRFVKGTVGREMF